jgi:hypothetical protein
MGCVVRWTLMNCPYLSLSRKLVVYRSWLGDDGGPINVGWWPIVQYLYSYENERDLIQSLEGGRLLVV